MSNTTKNLSDRDSGQTLQLAFNESDASLTTAGFLVGKVGRKVVVALATTNVANDSQIFSFSESGTALYSLKLIFTDATLATLLSAERIS